MTIRDRIVGLQRVRAGDLVAHPGNWRKHPEHQNQALQGVLNEIGYANALLAYEGKNGLTLIDGHLRAGLDKDQVVPVLVVDLNEKEANKLLVTLDPIGAMAETDTKALNALLEDITFDNEALNFMVENLANEQTELPVALDKFLKDAEPKIDQADELQDKWDTKRGQIWQIGPHRLMCGDCTSVEDRALLFGDEIPDFILTDPPYSSGGFQESSRSAGSIGSIRINAEGKKVQPTIANDRLSTRGYLALIKRAVGETLCQGAYVFTDWRMWVNLFDVMEASGFGVRQMIVWDKGAPGMGIGWRSQHEIIMFACRKTIKFDNHKAQGNVMNFPRTGNPNHPTEKPVQLLTDILKLTDAAQHVYDPFVGSGSTLVAIHNTNKIGYAMEIEPKYAAVTLQRMSDIGLMPELIN